MNFRIENIHLREVLKGSGLVFTAKILATSLGVVSSLIVARYYGPDIVGMIAIISSILAVPLAISRMGMDTAILRLIPEYIEKFSIEDAYSIYRKILIISLSFSALSGLTIFLLSPWLSNEFFGNEQLLPFFYLAALFVPFMVANRINSEALRALRSRSRFALIQWLPSLVNVVLLLMATFLFYYLYNPVYIFFITTAFMVPIHYWLVKNLFGSREKRKSRLRTRDLLALSFPMFLTSVMHLVMGQTDIIMLGAMASTHEVGIYSVALKLSLMTSFILVAVNAMLAPKFSQLFHAGKIDELRMIARNCAKIVFYATLPIVVIYLLFGNHILALFGEDFVSGHMALVLLVSGQFVNAAAGSVGYFLDMTGHQRAFQYIVAFGASLNIVLNYLLIPHFGINGAAFASMASIVVWNVMAAFAIKRRFGFFISYLPGLRRV